MPNAVRTTLLLAVVLTTATLFASPVRAASTYSDRVSGFETYASSTEGRFSGVAAGDLPGWWSTVVLHAPLSGRKPAAITGGSFDLETVLDWSPENVSGSITGGSVTQVAGFRGCANQQYEVVGTLSSVGLGGGGGTGTFDLTLTHYRTSVFGHCFTYSATVTGAIKLQF